MRILITRPKEDAARFAELIHSRGHEPVCASLLTVRFFDGPELTFEGVSAILATSANGVRALARRTEEREIPLFAVGPQTADAAKAAGFEKVECTDGDAATMAEAMLDYIKPEEGILVHAASADNENRLKTLLAEEGYRVSVEVLYEVIPEHKLPDAARAALGQGALDAVVVFSPRSADALKDCILRAGLTESCRSVAAICISAAAAKMLEPLPFKAVLVAEKPNQAAMLDAVERVAANP
ncbi:uroporphyrinogen-III synthase [Rhizomicrobium palustre]|uniref:Uroporphyrinogen-III synthase n=1 Tax=Rhizomicrobium palustre TaxID=189966 RepID=A0A846MY84_9PROT|nr:uroporphyrinogen-III synthase [Rhizomicrobium palustre]NIK88081.1 uroporphyrinogen-III synthase [Rhizomicrobium palustre]